MAVDLEYAKRLWVCLPFADADAGVAETQDCMSAMIAELAALRTQLAKAKANLEKEITERRCGECCGELSYCGEMSVDGPQLDCRACQLRFQLAESERLRGILARECREARRDDSAIRIGESRLTKARAATDAASALEEPI